MVEVPGHNLAALEKLLQNKPQILLVDDSAMNRMMLTYVTSPMTHKGMLIYGVCIGLLTVIIRNWGVCRHDAKESSCTIQPSPLQTRRRSWLS